MTTSIFNGQRNWQLDRDQEGHRTYTITHQVKAATTDGPAAVMLTPGLPLTGSFWAFDSDVDVWAFCYPTMRVRPRIVNEPNVIWDVTQTFSTKPLSRCQNTTVENPLLEPDKVSGSFVTKLKEASEDKDGNPIVSSSHEPIHGPQVEFDDHTAAVVIEQNRAVLGLATFTDMMNTVNDATLWGLAARKIKLSNVIWDRKLWGVCNFYYTRRLEFDIDFDTFDRDDILDEGTKVLNGHWDDTTHAWTLDNLNGGAPDSTDPTHFIRATDRQGNYINVILNGSGQPVTDMASAGKISVDYYPESNFLTLGIPTSF